MHARIYKWLLHGSRRSHLLWLLGIALVLIGAGYGLREPWPADEPRYALIAKEMVDSGRWLFPHVADVLYPDKPPLFLWMLALCYAVTGSVHWTFQLPSLLAALVTLVLVYDLGTRLWRRSTGIIASGLLLACLQFVLQGRNAQIDATVTLWITLGMYGLLRHLLLGPQWRWYVMGCAAMGAGVITKGVGFLPLLVFIPWGIARYRGWRLPALEGSAWQWSTGVLAFMAVILAWLGPMLHEVFSSTSAEMIAYRDEILFRQTGERYADAWHHLHPPWYYLVQVIPLFWFPLSFLLPWLIPAWMRRLRRGDARYALLLGWAVLVLLFFSLSPGKRGVYILPALPMLALAAAPLLAGLLQKTVVRRVLYWTALAFALLVAAAVPLYTLLRPADAQELLVPYGQLAPWLLPGLLGGGGIMLLLACRQRMLFGVGIFISWTWLVYGLVGYPVVNPVRSPVALMAEVRHIVGESAFGMVGWKEQMALHVNRPFVHFGFRRDETSELADALRWLAAADDRYLLVGGSASHDCLVPGQARELGYRHQEHWYLVADDDIAPDCVAGLRQEEPTELYHVDYLEPYR